MNERAMTYQVVVNHEQQYSLWPMSRIIPEGWRQVGVIGTKRECLAYVEKVWTEAISVNKTTRLLVFSPVFRVATAVT